MEAHSQRPDESRNSRRTHRSSSNAVAIQHVSTSFSVDSQARATLQTRALHASFGTRNLELDLLIQVSYVRFGTVTDSAFHDASHIVSTPVLVHQVLNQAATGGSIVVPDGARLNDSDTCL